MKTFFKILSVLVVLTSCLCAQQGFVSHIHTSTSSSRPTETCTTITGDFIANGSGLFFGCTSTNIWNPLLYAGTMSGATGAPICKDSNGFATTVGCLGSSNYSLTIQQAGTTVGTITSSSILNFSSGCTVGLVATTYSIGCSGGGGLADPGSNGIVKRTGLNVTSVAVAGTDYQAPLGFTPLAPSNNLSEVSNTATARSNLGLGSAATQSTAAFDAAGAASTESTRAQGVEATKPTCALSQDGTMASTSSSKCPSEAAIVTYVGSHGGGFTAGLDLGGVNGAEQVVGILSHTLPSLSAGYLQWNGSAWVFSIPGGGFSAGGDLSGSSTSQTVNGIKGYVLPSLATGYLYWNGSSWVFNSSGGGVSSFNSRTGAVVSATNDYNFSQIGGICTVAQGCTGTNSPGLIGGTNVSISGTWPNQTIAVSGVGVSSFNSRTGTVVSATNDYSFAQISGILAHSQLPTLLSADIPNNTANTTGTAAGLSANIAESRVTNLTTDLSGKQASLGFTPENVANKSTDGTMALNSTTLYPTQSAVKAYVLANAGGGVSSFNGRTGAVYPVSTDYTGITVTQVSFPPNPTVLTSNMVIFSTTTAMPFTIPTNGIAGACTSQLQFGILPTASWVGTFYRVPKTTAGCTGTPVSLGTVTVSNTGAQTWSVASTSFSAGDCIDFQAPNTVDTSAADPQLAVCVVK